MNALTLVYIAMGLLVAFTIAASDVGTKILEAWAGLFCDEDADAARRKRNNDANKKNEKRGDNVPWEQVEELCLDRVKGASTQASSIAVCLLLLYVVGRMFGFMQ
jgi:hypothetical protein